MAKLNALDLTGITPDSSEKANSVDEAVKIAQQASSNKPSAFESDLKAKIRDKSQFSFGHMPKFIIQIFDKQAKKAGMNRREYLYHLLREKGGDIPPYSQMDGRKL